MNNDKVKLQGMSLDSAESHLNTSGVDRAEHIGAFGSDRTDKCSGTFSVDKDMNTNATGVKEKVNRYKQFTTLYKFVKLYKHHICPSHNHNVKSKWKDTILQSVFDDCINCDELYTVQDRRFKNTNWIGQVTFFYQSSTGDKTPVREECFIRYFTHLVHDVCVTFPKVCVKLECNIFSNHIYEFLLVFSRK